jgi:hypothetical protein
MKTILTFILKIIAYIPIWIYIKILKMKLASYITSRALAFTIVNDNADIETEIYRETCDIAADMMYQGKWVTLRKAKDISDKIMNERFYGIEFNNKED